MPQTDDYLDDLIAPIGIENIIEVQQIRELLTNLDRTDLVRIFDILLECANKK